MKSMKTNSRDIINLPRVVVLTVCVSIVAIGVNATDRILGFLNFYSKVADFQLYANRVLLYLAGLLWLIYRGWICSMRIGEKASIPPLQVNPSTRSTPPPAIPPPDAGWRRKPEA